MTNEKEYTRMNILFFITPKSETAYLYDDCSLRQAIEMLTVNFISYKKIYFMTKMTARQYMRREIFSRLPVSRLMTTYEMMPKEMPSEML